MSRRRLGIVVLAVLSGILVMLPTAAVMTLAGTETGLRLIANWVSERPFGRVRIEVTDAQGSLVGGFRFGRLVVDNPWVHLEFEDVAGNARLLPMMWQTVNLPRLGARTALIQILPRPPQPEGARRTPRVRFMPGALTLRVGRLNVEQGRLQLASGTTWDATALDLATVVRQREIRVLGGRMDLPNLRVQTDGRLMAGWPLRLHGLARLNIHAEGQPDWIIHGEYDGDLDVLPVTARITAPFRATIEGRALELTRSWRFIADAGIEDFDVAAFGGGRALGLIKGQLALTGDRNGYTANGRLDPAGLAAGPFDVDFRGGYGSRRVRLDQVLIDHAPSGAHATVRGAVLVQPGGPRLELTGNWRDFRWPLAGDVVATRSPSGSFSLTGTAPWALQASGEVAPDGLEPLPVSVRGTLAGDHLVVDEGEVRAWGGQSTLHGEVRWTPQEQWSFHGQVQGLDLANLRRDLPGRVDFTFEASGRGFGESGEIDVGIGSLGGQLRGLPVGGAGGFERRGGPATRTWRFREVALRVGGSRLDLDGTTGALTDLRFDVLSDDLGLLGSQLRGRLEARGRLSGHPDHPTLRLQLQGRDFASGEDTLARLEADLDVQLADNGRTRGTLDATGLHWAGRTIEEVKLDLSGTSQASVLGLNVRAEPLSVALRARGAFTDTRWRGVVDSFDIRDGDSLALRLAEFAPLTLARDHVDLGRACLAGEDTRLCLQGAHDSGHWRAMLETRNLPLRALTAGLSRDTSFEGRVGLTFNARGGEGRLPEATLQARLSDALLIHRQPNGREDRVTLGTGTVDGNLQGDAFALHVGLDAGDSGRLVGRLEGDRSDASWPTWPVRGEVELATDALGVLDLFFTGIDRAAGRLAAHVNVSGELGAPRLTGDLQVRNGEIDVYQVNLGIRGLDLDAHLDLDALQIDGTLKAGAGTAQIGGRLTWSEGEPHGTLTVRGERLQVADVPEAQIEASPDLRFSIAGRRVDVEGEVLIPRARLDPADITNAVLASSDERLVGTPPPDPRQQFQVTSNLRLTLGDDVTIDTFGLSGRLAGSLVTRSDEAEVTRASGELSVAEGRYAAFGRNLDIERGRLIFNNGPVGDPGVDLRAQKVFPDITAGVNVRGTLRAPRMTFFSEPAIPQSQIVSLILAGGSLETVQNNDRRGTAGADLLAQGGAILAQQFGSRVGIEDVGIESDLANETSLVLGKYLSPRLYVSYGISLAEAINTVKLRYTIDEHWTIKTESGRESSADIVYTIRK